MTAATGTAAATAAYLRSRHRFRAAEAAPWLLLALVYFVLQGYLALGSQIVVMILFALSLDLILGYAGIVSLGHAAFFGVGAYAAALLAKHGWAEPISGLVVAAAAAAAIGAASGWVLLRTRGLTLLMLTMAVAILLQELSNARSDITGGFDGIAFQMSPLLGEHNFGIYFKTQYVYAAVVLLLAFLLVRRIVHAPFGRQLEGIRENVKRMHAIGSPVHRRLVTVYTISAALAGVAGGLFAQTQQFVTLAVLSFDLSGKILIMLILGGTGRLYGAFVGVTVYMILEDQLAKQYPQYWQLGIGAVLVLVVLFARRGLFGLAEDAVKRLRGRR
ncbi:MAG TPA: branched-chain amino acid ABC transporter permease [Alphaproteobacteria bacterium]|jgi:branched-chain amino acid transport system permease protein|nr:branched-chain amino acid ABC transporter permease [Alphaproteobacteria bacterium]